MADSDNNPKHLSCDAISRLPDEVLQTILDQLSVAEAVSTGFLSRRWRDLWKHITIIEFNPSWVELTGKEIVPSLNEFICHHKGQKIYRFSVGLAYKPEMSPHVDSWVLFAINKNVEDLELDFDVADTNIRSNTAHAPCYKLLPCVFNNKSLFRLVLCFCALELPKSIQLNSLTVLRLHRIELPDDAIHVLTSNAPVLQQLSLSDCNRTIDLHVHVAPNSRFCNLVIIDNFFPVKRTTKMDVKAPTALQVVFMGAIPRAKYIVEEVSECFKAHFNLKGMFGACGKYGVNILANNLKAQKYEKVLQELLGGFQDAKVLNLCSWCIQLLSLRELRNVRRLRFNCTSLEITVALRKWELPGIIYMLKACHNLEELIIIVNPNGEEGITIPEDYLSQHDFDERRFVEMQDSGLELENLTFVQFESFYEDYVIQDDEIFDLNRYFHGARVGTYITKLLKGHAVSLESIVYSSMKQQVRVFLKGEDDDEEEEEEGGGGGEEEEEEA